MAIKIPCVHCGLRDVDEFRFGGELRSCPSCLVEVDGVPSVRSCSVKACDGAVLKSQNAWPSPKFDVMRALDFFSFLMPVGFYYKTFIQPKFAWPLVEKFIRRAAGLGV